MRGSEPLPRRPALILWALFALLAAALAVAPKDRATWALENGLVLLFAICMFALRHKFVPSARASILLFVFLCMHEVGAHYTYSEVPYDRWFEAVSGSTLSALLGFERNHFDRLVHFAAGLLLTRLLREFFARFSPLGELGARIAALAAVMSASMIYELIEWAAAIGFGEGTGTAYLGTQGDPWDAQTDMALATLGSILALIDRDLFASFKGTRRAHTTQQASKPSQPASRSGER